MLVGRQQFGGITRIAKCPHLLTCVWSSFMSSNAAIMDHLEVNGVHLNKRDNGPFAGALSDGMELLRARAEQ